MKPKQLHKLLDTNINGSNLLQNGIQYHLYSKLSSNIKNKLDVYLSVNLYITMSSQLMKEVESGM